MTWDSVYMLRVSQLRRTRTPLAIYLGVMIHTKTRKRELVDQLFDLGLSVSYDRVLEISTELGNKVCHYYQTQKAVCPPQLKCGLFTTAAVDNIEHKLHQCSLLVPWNWDIPIPASKFYVLGTFSRTSFSTQ